MPSEPRHTDMDRLILGVLGTGFDARMWLGDVRAQLGKRGVEVSIDVLFDRLAYLHALGDVAKWEHPDDGVSTWGLLEVDNHHQAQTTPTRLDLLRTIDELRVLVESGEVVGVAIATAHANGNDGSAYDLGDASISTLVLALERVKLRLLAHGEAADTDDDTDVEEE